MPTAQACTPLGYYPAWVSTRDTILAVPSPLWFGLNDYPLSTVVGTAPWLHGDDGHGLMLNMDVTTHPSRARFVGLAGPIAPQAAPTHVPYRGLALTMDVSTAARPWQRLRPAASSEPAEVYRVTPKTLILRPRR